MSNTLKFGNGTWATKKGSTLAYNDENDNYKPLPFTTTRASGATRVNKEGLIEVVENDRPRIDYTDSANGALKLEPQRTNLVTYSEDFSNASWTKASLTVDSNSTTSPDGSLNADKITKTSGGGGIIYTQSISGTYTVSSYMKADTSNYSLLYVNFSSGTDGSVYFDLTDGVISSEVSVNGFIENIGNGWYRCGATFTTPASLSDVRFFPAEYNSTSATSGSIYIYGAQLEAGSYATSYIPTQGSAVTRVADVCNNGGNEQVINSTEGVLYFEFKNTDTSNYKLMSISGATTDNRVFIGTRLTTGYIYYFVVSGGVTQASYISTQLADNFAKVAVKYKANDFSFWINGLKVSTDSSGSTPIGLDSLQFNGGSGTLDFHGNIKDVRVYNTALTDNELKQLTTI